MLRGLRAVLFTLPVATLCLASPAEQEDARIERERILRTADQFDIVAPKVSELERKVADVQSELSAARTEIAALKSQIGEMQANQAKEREALIDEVSKIIASTGKKKPGSEEKEPKEKAETKSSPEKSSTAETKPAAKEEAAPKPSSTSASEKKEASDKTEASKERGFYHTVASGETLSAIAKAYQAAAGQNVTVADIIKANNLGQDAKLKVGQRLFIPKK